MHTQRTLERGGTAPPGVRERRAATSRRCNAGCQTAGKGAVSWCLDVSAVTMLFPRCRNVRELVNGQAHYSTYCASDGCVPVGWSISVHTSRGSHAGLPLVSEHPSRNTLKERANSARTAQKSRPAKRCCEPYKIVQLRNVERGDVVRLVAFDRHSLEHNLNTAYMSTRLTQYYAAVPYHENTERRQDEGIGYEVRQNIRKYPRSTQDRPQQVRWTNPTHVRIAHA